MSRFHRQPTARRDLVNIFRYYAESAGVSVARRFLTESQVTFNRVAQMPGIGACYEPDDPVWADVRYFPISRFKIYVVFNRPIAEGIEVLRVLHGARDIDRLLSEEFGIASDDVDSSSA